MAVSEASRSLKWRQVGSGRSVGADILHSYPSIFFRYEGSIPTPQADDKKGCQMPYFAPGTGVLHQLCGRALISSIIAAFSPCMICLCSLRLQAIYLLLTRTT